MRYLLCSFFYIVLTVQLFAQTTVVIPDPAFKTFLDTYYSTLLDSNKDLIIDNAALVTGAFYCGEANISSLEGIQYFVNIDKLECQKNKLSTLPDLSALTKLTNLYCAENQLISVPSLDRLVNLQRLSLAQNKLTSLPDLNALTNLTELIIFRNQLTSIPDLTLLTNLEKLYCFENAITSIGKMPASLKELSFGENLMTYVPDISLSTGLVKLVAYTNRLQSVPDLTMYTALTELNLGTNQLTSAPTGIPALSQLTLLTLDNNLLTHLPDLSQLTLLRDCDLRNNAFTFEDLAQSVANPNAGTWTVCPQDSIQQPLDTRITEGQPLTISFSEDEGFPGLTFSWYRNNILVTQTNEAILDLSAVSKADNGRWYCQITSSNPTLSACMLSTRMFTISVRPDFVGSEKELTITPNGDGKNDEYLFDQQGLLKVYNSEGVLLDQQSTPCYWNGNTSSGKPLGTGYYLIRINDEITYPINIIR